MKYLIQLMSLYNQLIGLYNVSVFHVVVCAIFAIGFTVYWIQFLEVPKHLPIFRRKPFNCQACLSFWITLLVLPFPAVLLYIIGGAFLTGIITPLVIKWLRN